jgi:PhnB protein
MTTKAKPIPDGYHTVTPYLYIRGAAAAIEFYKKAFGAVELYRFPGSDGKVGHAEIKIGDSPIMLADENVDMGAISPQTIGGTPFGIMLYVEDVDAVFNRAVAAGAEQIRAVADQFYGDRTGGLKDPFGFQWWIATHIEDVPHEEMEERAKAAKH